MFHKNIDSFILYSFTSSEMMKLHRVAEQRRGCLSTSFISKDKSLLSQKYYAVLSKRSQGDLWTKKMKKGTVELTPLEKRSHCLSLRNHIVFEEKFTCTFCAFHFLFLKFMQVIGWVYINIHRQTERQIFFFSLFLLNHYQCVFVIVINRQLCLVYLLLGVAPRIKWLFTHCTRTLLSRFQQ